MGYNFKFHEPLDCISVKYNVAHKLYFNFKKFFSCVPVSQQGSTSSAKHSKWKQLCGIHSFFCYVKNMLSTDMAKSPAYAQT